ncbi:MAG: VOC family protein [Acidobacteria bacterium]|nr:VOC family protein [Acidobacteriota bacterium]MCW5968556.1 VOC family protein [Blastocatellales bacterium]
MSKGQSLAPAVNAVDHLLFGINDLDRGISWVEKMTGVKAVAGGSHPGVGTRNALVSLGGRRYLEIIAPDPAQASYNSNIDVRNLAEPRLITWAALAMDINAAAGRVRAAGYELFGPRDGSRARPDGKMLKWKSMGVISKFGLQGIDPIPFFIEWAGDSVHPTQDSPKGCELQSFEIEHPDPTGVLRTLKDLGIEANVKHAKESRLRAVLKTPKGKVELT